MLLERTVNMKLSFVYPTCGLTGVSRAFLMQALGTFRPLESWFLRSGLANIKCSRMV